MSCRLYLLCGFTIFLLTFSFTYKLFAELASLDIGSSSVEGSTAFSAGTYTIKADGIDIWNNRDMFRFVYRGIKGDFEAVVRVLSFESTEERAKVGLMARQSVEPGSSFAFSMVTPRHGALLQWRLSGEKLCR